MTSFNIYDHATQQQIDNFKPTYLYIKRHKVTGLLYFGQTRKLDILKYNGSGTLWNNHIKKHGKEYIETVWYCLFTDIETIVKTALFFTEINNIVESKDFANLRPENGLDGNIKGMKLSEEHVNKIKQSRYYVMPIVCDAAARSNKEKIRTQQIHEGIC
jgi:hypothetical protein